MRTRIIPILLFLSIVLLVDRSQAANPPTSQPAGQKLEQRITEITFDGLTFPQVVAAIERQTHLNLAEIKEIESPGLDKTKKLHGKVSNITVNEALQLAAIEAGAASPVALTADAKSSKPVDPNAVETRVFKTGRLIGKMLKRDQNRMELNDTVVKSIQEAVAPDTWRDAGGTIGTIRFVGDDLIVTQTNANIAKIEQLLNKLEK